MEIRKVDTLVDLPAIAPVHPLSPELRQEQAQLIQAVEKLNEARIFGEKSELTFSIDRETRKAIMKIVDRETQEVIQQIPPEYVLRLAQDLKP
jgi:flagellar protein FlaG